MGPGRHHAAEHLRAQAGPDGQAAAQTLRHGYDVGPDPRVFTGEEPACPPGAGLYLVDDEQDIPGRAKLAYPPQIRDIQGQDTTLPLYTFEHHGADRAVYRLFHRGGIVRGQVAEPLGEGKEVLMEAVLPSGG